MKNPQLQVKRDFFIKNRLVETPDTDLALGDGEILVQIKEFAYTANNITYAVAGDMIGYWQFFPPVGEATAGWGVIPVWGFAEVVKSTIEEVPLGDRLFGYFQPAKYLKMKPVAVKPHRFVDGAEHRSQLPAAYNLYRRVHKEPTYNPAFDREMMLLFPLHLTSFCLWDFLQAKDWFEAKQVILLSASSKTSTGLGYALQDDENAPPTIGMTSPRNLNAVCNMGIYDQVISYSAISKIDASIPTVIVDMSGNTKVMAALHTHLGDRMKFTSNVGLTHWSNAQPQTAIIAERSQFFFAPGQMQKRIKEWGADEFNQKTSAFIMHTAAKTRGWLQFKEIDGLTGLAAIHPAVCAGEIPANEGLIVKIT